MALAQNEIDFKKGKIVYRGVHLSRYISDENIKRLDSIQSRYVDDPQSTLKTFTTIPSYRLKEISFELNYFIAYNFPFSHGQTTELFQEIIERTGTENWNTGYYHIFCFLLYEEKYKEMSFVQLEKLYNLISIYCMHKMKNLAISEIETINHIKKRLTHLAGGFSLD